MSIPAVPNIRAEKYQGRINNLISQLEELQNFPDFSLDSRQIVDIIKKISWEAKHAIKAANEYFAFEKAKGVLMGGIVRYRMGRLGGIRSSVIRERCDLFKKFYDTEKQYCNSLENLVGTYIIPFRKCAIANKFKGVNQDIFGPIESVKDFAMRLFKLLSVIYQKDWPDFSKTGEAFLSVAVNLIDVGRYIIHFTANKQAITDMLKNDPKIFQFFQAQAAAASDPNGFSIDGFLRLLSLPSRRTKSYKQYIQGLIDLSTMTTETEVLSAALSSILRVDEFVTMSHSTAENQKQTASIIQRLDNKKLLATPNDSADPSCEARSFKYEGELIDLTEKNHRKIHYLLFSDCLVFTKQSGNEYKVQDVYFLKNANLSAEFSSGDMSRLSVTTCDGKTCTFMVEDIKEFRDIEAALTTIAHNVNGVKPVFGVHLSELLVIEGTKIPNALVAIANVILPSIETKGLFRVSGHAEIISDLIVKFNTHQWKPEDAGGVSVHNYCSVFKTFFSMLPEPLLTFKGYDKAAAFLNESSEISEDEMKSFTRSLVKSLPESNRNVADFLFDFLAKISLKSNKNMMTVTNLGIVFTPPLLRPRSESIENAMLSVKMAELVSVIIEERAVKLNEEKLEKSSSTEKTKEKRARRKGHKKLSRTLRINKLVAKKENDARPPITSSDNLDIRPPSTEPPPPPAAAAAPAPEAARRSELKKSSTSSAVEHHVPTPHSLRGSSSEARGGSGGESSESSTSSECSTARKSDAQRRTHSSHSSHSTRKLSLVVSDGGSTGSNDIAPPPLPPPSHLEMKKSTSVSNVAQLKQGARCLHKSSLAIAPPPLPESGSEKKSGGDSAKNTRLSLLSSSSSSSPSSSHVHRKLSVPTLPPPREAKAGSVGVPPPVHESPLSRQHPKTAASLAAPPPASVAPGGKAPPRPAVPQAIPPPLKPAVVAPPPCNPTQTAPPPKTVVPPPEAQ